MGRHGYAEFYWRNRQGHCLGCQQPPQSRLKSSELRSPLALGQALEQAGILKESTPTIFHQLRNFRNAAAHASEFAFTPEAATEYGELTLGLIEYLRKV